MLQDFFANFRPFLEAFSSSKMFSAPSQNHCDITVNFGGQRVTVTHDCWIDWNGTVCWQYDMVLAIQKLWWEKHFWQLNPPDVPVSRCARPCQTDGVFLMFPDRSKGLLRFRALKLRIIKIIGIHRSSLTTLVTCAQMKAQINDFEWPQCLSLSPTLYNCKFGWGSKFTVHYSRYYLKHEFDWYGNLKGQSMIADLPSVQTDGTACFILEFMHRTKYWWLSGLPWTLIYSA